MKIYRESKKTAHKSVMKQKKKGGGKKCPTVLRFLDSLRQYVSSQIVRAGESGHKPPRETRPQEEEGKGQGGRNKKKKADRNQREVNHLNSCGGGGTRDSVGKKEGPVGGETTLRGPPVLW